MDEMIECRHGYVKDWCSYCTTRLIVSPEEEEKQEYADLLKNLNKEK